ncbi:MFS transporter [Rhodococcus sp. Leaf7]|uniref:MFS transporter n=1 Tax=unclassified Rhodococcus (in: high G+C Gram-positive bacteria) TaxID=192944 RepID=UPI0006FACBD4|nr:MULTISPECIES: MFS transporter [unclassified Rhodococcus (in: high G+C Gram-positive bacteria)]KQU07770.1 MFS transporter [Rhodococcus sp. Leaf7]KQU43287.1 MFS transporter [Rhodococcus sp. Leaf247]
MTVSTDRSFTDAPIAQDQWDGHVKGSREYRKLVAALLLAGIATFAQLYSVQGILPLIASSLSITPSQSSLAVGCATVGVAVAVLPWSMVADRVGRVRAMSISIVTATALGLVVPLSTSLPMLLGVRFVEGAALGGLPAIAIAYLSEEVDRRHTAVAAATYVSGTTIGGLLGRIVAGPVAEATNWRIGTLTVSIIAALAAATFLRLAPTPRRALPDGQDGPGLREKIMSNLRDPGMRALYGQAFLLMGGFVTVYNYLGFRLEAAPFGLPQSLISLIFVAYLSGTVSSRVAGQLAGRFGRSVVLAGSTGVMIAGVALTAFDALAIVLVGLVIFTVGFFAAHAIASGWTGHRATVGRAQSASLYNLFYYGGSSIVGWTGGVIFQAFGWTAMAAFVISLAVLAALWSLVLRTPRPAQSR